MPRTDTQLYNLQVKAKCYVETVDAKDKAKVIKARLGQPSAQPRSALGIVAWELGKRAYLQEQAPKPPDPPVPPVGFGVAPRTYNYAPANNSDPLFCKNSPGVVVHADGSFSDKYSRYDSDGRDIDGRRDRFRQVPGLNQSNNTNGLDPCTLYNGLTEWPAESYLQ